MEDKKYIVDIVSNINDPIDVTACVNKEELDQLIKIFADNYTLMISESIVRM